MIISPPQEGRGEEARRVPHFPRLLREVGLFAVLPSPTPAASHPASFPPDPGVDATPPMDLCIWQCSAKSLHAPTPRASAIPTPHREPLPESIPHQSPPAPPPSAWRRRPSRGYPRSRDPVHPVHAKDAAS